MSRYHDDYLDELEKDVEAARSYRYKRDREAIYERELSYRSYPPQHLDDPYYHPYDDPESHVRLYPTPRETRGPYQENAGGYVYGQITLFPPSPFEEKPKRSAKPPNCNTVFVGSLPEKVTEKHISDLFSECGRVLDVRIPRGKRFAHVEFEREEAVDKAIELSNCKIRVGPQGVPGTSGTLYVDFAHHRGEPEVHRKIQEGEMMLFNTRNVTTLSNNLHYDDAFSFAVKNVVHWFDKGHCDPTTANVFYGLLNNIHSHCRKFIKNLKSKEEEIKMINREREKFFENMKENLGLMKLIYESANKQKAWDSFTKAQRKSITQWKEQVSEVEIQTQSLCESKESIGMPAAKVQRIEGTELEANYERALKEIEQLKTDHEVAIERREREILQLKNQLEKFKQSYPDEWSKALVDDHNNNGKSPLSQRTVKDEDMDDEEYEVLDGVEMSADGKAGSLAAAAAAYAQLRTRVGSTDTSSGTALSDTEIAIVSVLAAFLTVHPLGATIDEITTYFKNFNRSYNSYYLESLLCRLPTVFQASQSPLSTSDGNETASSNTAAASNAINKWWFLGFQTCTTVGNTSTSSLPHTTSSGDTSASNNHSPTKLL